MGRKLTTEIFIKKANDIHGIKYIYLKSIFINFTEKMIIICPVLGHGEFYRNFNDHIYNKRGCKKCLNDDYIKKCTEEFIFNAKIIHGDKYLYNKTICKNKGYGDVIITCPIEWHGDFNQSYELHIKRKYGCPKCSGQNRTEEDFLREANRIHGNKYIYNREILNFSLWTQHVNIICPIDGHGVFQQTPQKHINLERGCSKCGWSQHDNNYIDNFIENYNLKIKRIGDYKQAHIQIDWRCLICDNIWPAMPSSILQGSGCPECATGKNESIVREFLKTNNINTETIRIPVNILKQNARPDFYIPSMNLILEYNGEQHYKPVQFGGTSIENAKMNFEKQKVRDSQLREYCKNNNINLLEIDGRKYTNWKLIDYLYDYFNINNTISA